MKHAEVRAQKNQIRERIDALRADISAKLFGSSKLPQRIVDGSHQEVIEFKDACDEASEKYHCNHAPGAKKTVSELEAIESRLKVILNQLS
jgi:hypothetical protein